MAPDIEALPDGARFYRADLHIHSCVGSHDVKDATCTPEAIVDLARNEGLSIIAIADHNEISAVARAEAAAKGTGLLVVPAIELSTPQGHLLCYFPTHDALQKFYAKLTIADRGKDTSHCQQGMVDCLGLVESHSGFAILAHVDAGSGFETLNPGATPHKKNVLHHRALVGIELKSGSSDISYSETDLDVVRKGLGKERVEKLGLGTRGVLARILNSDSHTLAKLGRNAAGDAKVTRYKMNDLSFEGLHLALLDSDARVRIEDEIPASIPYVAGIQMSGGYLDGQAIKFSANLNCIIGGRGTGKSTTFEAIRYVAGHPGDPSSVVDSDVWPDQVDLYLRDQAGAEHQISQGKGGVPTNADDPFDDPITFPIECYRQGETHSISQQAQGNPAALLDYLDRFIDVEGDLEAEQVACSALEELHSKIQAADDQLAKIPRAKQELQSVQGQIATVEKQKGKEVIALQRTVAQEKAVRDAILKEAQAISAGASAEALKASIEAIKNAAQPGSLQLGGVEYTAITAITNTFEQDLTSADATIKASATKLLTGVQEQLRAWYAKAQQTNQQVEAKKKALEAQGVKVELAYFQKLATDETRLTTELARLDAVSKERTRLLADKKRALGERWAIRDRIAMKRSAFASKANQTLKATLTDLSVTLKYEHGALSPAANGIITTAMGWRTNQVPRVALLTESLTVRKLLEAIEKGDTNSFVGLWSEDLGNPFGKQDAQSIIERLGDPAVRNRLEACEIVDRPRLIVSREITKPDGSKGVRTREFKHLSLGQQQSVLLTLLLSTDSNFPLIIDQPEDDLDSQFIYHTIVPALRHAKERRQVIVVTHNANIAVLGDAEQVIVLGSTAEKSEIQARGSIDDAATRKRACAVLEGATDAFKRRARIYGYRLTEISSDA